VRSLFSSHGKFALGDDKRKNSGFAVFIKHVKSSFCVQNKFILIFAEGWIVFACNQPQQRWSDIGLGG
jgi:hypothetical protein